MSRRLPVYILIDTSSSMRGEPIKAVKNGLNSLFLSLSKNPYALETACVSVITYNTKAEQVVPLIEAYKVVLPDIEAKGQSAMGKALGLLCERADAEIRKTTPEQKGDWKPLVFLLSDGGHTGAISKPIAELKKRSWGVTVACAAGANAHLDVLHKIADTVVQITSTDSVSIESFFQWVSNSVATSSCKLETMATEQISVKGLPLLPKEIVLAS